MDDLPEQVGDARFVLLGEASHGTHEFYAWRAAVTRRLVAEKGFGFVAVEGDWPDCYSVHCSVTGASGAPEDPALADFGRWPTWMWANEEVVAFTRWLRKHNAERPRAYARATRLVPTSCEDPVVEMLTDLRRAVGDDGGATRDARFDAEQNARVAAGAEAYYRAMVTGGPTSWNVRDCHMADTLDRLVAHRNESSEGAAGGAPAKAVVWEHNTHVGDARFTDMADAGIVNVGQLVRERHGEDDVVLVGFGSYSGSVVAADAWGDPAQVMPVPPARAGSIEALLHDSIETPAALFVFPAELPDWLTERRDHRAIGVVYRPDAERWGNYVPTVLGRRYDAFCWFDETRALAPLRDTHPTGAEQETWPYGR
jgi:erythromycin esterase-like protein